MKKGRFIWGMGLIAASGFMMADLMGYLPSDVNGFKVTITFVLVLSAIYSVLKFKIAGAVMPLAFALIINRSYFGIEGNAWMILVIGGLLTAGLGILFDKPSVTINGKPYRKGEEFYEERVTGKGSMSISSVFGSRTKKVVQDDFRYLKVDCVFGSMDLYLNNSTITDRATVEIDNVFASTRIYVSRDVSVFSNIDSVFGGVKDHNNDLNSQGPQLYLEGDCVFGGIEIIYI